MYNKDTIKQTLTIEQVYDLLVELGGEPQDIVDNSYFVSRTICHNEIGNGSYKLYYYDNTKLFKCYTECSPDTFDIYQLVQKAYHKQQCSLPKAISFVAKYFGFSPNDVEFPDANELLDDWRILKSHEKLRDSVDDKKIVELKAYDPQLLINYPQPHIIPWEQEDINYDVLIHNHIYYDPIAYGIIIPHYDIDNRLIGIRERTLAKEEEEYGKYRPAVLNGKMYNHPLGFNLYNLNNSKDNISAIGKCFIFEAEKSCMLYQSFFGIDNDITCACCGSNITSYQISLLLTLGVQEIIIGFDKQFKELRDDEWKRWTDKLTSFHRKYGSYCKISFLFDTKQRLNYKDSPIDQGKEIFMELFEERVML